MVSGFLSLESEIMTTKPLSDNTTVTEVIGLNNKILRASEKKGIPFLAIKKAINYGAIEYDFIALDYELKSKAMDQIKIIFHEMACHEDVKEPWEYYGCNPTHGISVKIKLNTCRQYALKIRDIVINRDNWKLTYFAEMYNIIDQKTRLEKGD
ncbi:MAG: hypothetical protein ACLQG5_03945 [Methanobacterium sp.]